MLYKINWRGEKCKNYYANRNGHTPLGTCSHITAGNRQSVFYWFTSPSNKQASSTFVVGRKGEIDQYVDIRHAAWTQGLSAADGGYERTKSKIVQDKKGINPNHYLVSIEYEGYVEGHKDANGNVVVEEFGINGDITEEQFLAGCWLNKYIQREIERIWGNQISLNSYFVEGHFRIDPKRKPYCPGPKFPWTRYYSELAIADSMDFNHYEERISALKDPAGMATRAYAIVTRIDQLNTRLTDPKWGASALQKLGWLMPLVPNAQAPTDVVGFVMGEYKAKDYDGVLAFEPVMKEKGLL